MIRAAWSQGEGRVTPKKMYEATVAGAEENKRRQQIWQEFCRTVDGFLEGEIENA